jgi:hypothetical protein
LLSNHIPKGSLDPKNDYDQELLAFMRPVTLADLLDRHVSDLVPRQALEREIERFCRNTVQLSKMAQQAKDAETRENEVRRARQIETSLEVSRVLEMKEGLPPGSLQAACEAEAQDAQRMAEDFMRQCVAKENSEFA